MSERGYEFATKALLGVVLLFAGWLFSTLAGLQRETRQEVEKLAVEVGKLQERVRERCD